MTTAYELAAKIDFKELEDFIKALKEMKSQADKSGKSLNDNSSKLNKNQKATKNATSKTKNFKSALLGAGGEVRGFSTLLKAARNPMVAFGVALGAAISGFATAQFTAAKAALELKKLATVAGVTTTSLSTLAAIGKKVDIDMQGASDLFRDFGEFLGEFALEGAGPAAFAYKELGVEIRDTNGNLRDTGSVFNDVIAKLASVSNEAERSALAVQILGSDGNKLSAILDTNTTSLDALAKKLKVTNDIVGEEQTNALAKSAEAYNSLSKSIGQALRGSFADTAPSTETFFRLLEKLRPTISFLSGLVADLTNSFLFLVNGLVAAAIGVQEFLIKIADLGPIRILINTLKELRDIIELVNNGFESTEGTIKLTASAQARVDSGEVSVPKTRRGRNGPVPTGTSSAPVPTLSAEQVANATLTKEIDRLLTQSNNALTANIEDAVQRQEVIIKQLKTKQSNALFDADDSAASLERIQALEAAQKIALGIEETKLIKLKTAASEKETAANALTNQQYKARIALIRTITREQENSITKANIDGVAQLPFSPQELQNRFDAFRTVLKNESESEREALQERLSAASVFGSKRAEILAQFDEKVAAKRSALDRQQKSELVTNLGFIENQYNRLESILLQQRNGSFSNSLSLGASGAEQEKFQRESLNRQIDQQRQALNTQLTAFKEHEEAKKEIQIEFERDAKNRRERLEEQIAQQQKDQVKKLAEPFTNFFEELTVGFAKSGRDGAASWSEIKEAAIINLQDILIQQLANAAVMQALNIGLGLFGGGASAGGAPAPDVAAVTLNAVPSPPQAVPQLGAASSADNFNAEIKIDISGNNNNPADVERSAQLGAERALNAAIDRRMAYQTRANGMLNRRVS